MQQSELLFYYACTIVKVIDGDTVDIDVDLGFGVMLKKERVRLFGIDAPESRTSDPEEKHFGRITKRRVAELLPIGETFVLESIGFKGKFGRILGNILLENMRSVSSILLEEFLAIKYEPSISKEAKKEAHEANRSALIKLGVEDYRERREKWLGK